MLFYSEADPYAICYPVGWGGCCIAPDLKKKVGSFGKAPLL